MNRITLQRERQPIAAWTMDGIEYVFRCDCGHVDKSAGFDAAHERAKLHNERAHDGKYAIGGLEGAGR